MTDENATDPDESGDWARTAEWPIELTGVTETVVTTLGPNDRWNVAALGIFGPDASDGSGAAGRVTARTWGRTRTWRNFQERGEGYVHFHRDPVLFVEAALDTVERDEPILEEAAAWVHVTVDHLADGADEETQWVEWALAPTETVVRTRTVPTIDRGHAAVVEATVAASRLDVPAFDADELRARIEHLESVARRCGGPAEQAAFDRLLELIDDPDRSQTG